MRSERLRWRDVRSATPFRLTVLLGVLFLAALWATLGAGYLLAARALTARTDHILRTRADALLAESAAGLPERVRAEIANAAPGVSYFVLLDRAGKPMAGNLRLTGPGRPGLFSLRANGAHGPLRVMVSRTRAGGTLVLARDISQIAELRRQLLRILVASGAAGTGLVLAAAVALSFAPLRRVRDFARASRRIAAGDFAARMPIAGRHDELDQVAGTVNLMVDEVAHVIAQVKAATDAIAHDLRTPLTRVRASLGRARSLGGLPPAHQAILDDAVADLDAVVARFAALLRLSELEAGGRRAGLRRIELPPLLEELAEFYRPLAEEKGIDLLMEARPLPPTEGDRELLFEAVANLLDNAIKFARSRVRLRTGAAGGVLLEVVDDGPGVPPDERDAVMRRFHRARGAAGVEGTGLGLAVASAILHLHGFTLELDDAGPGLVARVRLGAAK